MRPFDNSKLRNPATDGQIDSVEEILSVKLNIQHRNFLKKYDGGIICNDRIIIYCAEKDGMKGDNLLTANITGKRMDMKDYVLIGRDAGEVRFFMKKKDLNNKHAPIYAYYLEFGEIELLFDDFESFINNVCEDDK